jgi:hypothetical protein
MATQEGDPLSVHSSYSIGGSVSVTSRQGSRRGITTSQVFLSLSSMRLTRIIKTQDVLMGCGKRRPGEVHPAARSPAMAAVMGVDRRRASDLQPALAVPGCTRVRWPGS